jgi:hypothetical protein
MAPVGLRRACAGLEAPDTINMTSTSSARMAGVLSRIEAAGHTTRQVHVETPDGVPMTLTLIDAGRRRMPGRKRDERCGIEPDQGEQIAEGSHSAETPMEWAQPARRMRA